MRKLIETRRFYIFIFFLIFFGCNGSNRETKNSATEGLSTMEEMRFNQYMVYGQPLYEQHCANCHQADGSGLGQLIPPLAASDYMLEEMDRTVCLIRYGLEGSIMVNGKEYQQKMPGNERLTALEIAQITTYIANSWGNDEGYISVQDITNLLEKCQ